MRERILAGIVLVIAYVVLFGGIGFLLGGSVLWALYAIGVATAMFGFVLAIVWAVSVFDS